MDFVAYIEPELLILVPALYLLGMFFKNGPLLKDKHIPLVLCLVGIVLAVVWLLATSVITGWQSILLAAFTAFVQGVFCAGVAVLANQIIKQEGKRE